MSSLKLENISLNGVRVLIKDVSNDTIRKSGIIIPESCKNDSRYKHGVVLSIGNDLHDQYPDQLQDGDKVMYNEHLADKITLDIDGDMIECAICEYKRDVHIIIKE